MSIFQWLPEYEIDHAMIDQQHKTLLQIAEKLFNGVINQESDADLNKRFQELLNYTQKHFLDEEQYFESVHASELEKHRDEHGLLAKELVEVWQKEQLGFQTEKGRLLLNWVEERLLPHMMIDDQETYNSTR